MTLYLICFFAAKMWTESIATFIKWTALGTATDYIKPGAGVTIDIIEVLKDIKYGNYGEIAGILMSMALDFTFVGVLSVGKYFVLKVGKEAVFHAAKQRVKGSLTKMGAKEIIGALIELLLDENCRLVRIPISQKC